jgi:hypothetical protein
MYQLNQQEIDYFNSLDSERQGALAATVEMRARLNSIMVGQAEEYFPDNTDVQIMRKNSDEVMADFGLEVETRFPTRGTNKPAVQDTTAPIEQPKGPQIMEFDDDMMPKNPKK